MKLGELYEDHNSDKWNEIPLFVEIEIDAIGTKKLVAVSRSYSQTEKGVTRVVLVPSKPRTSRAKSQPVKVSKETAEMLRENGIDPAMLIRDGVMEYESQGVNLTPMLSQADDYSVPAQQEEGIEDGVITDTAS